MPAQRRPAMSAVRWLSGVPSPTRAASASGTTPSPETQPAPAPTSALSPPFAQRQAWHRGRARPRSPTGASSADSIANVGAAWASAPGVTGVSRAPAECGLARPAAERRRQVSRRPLVAERQARGSALPSHAASRPARKVDRRLRRPPGRAELAVHHDDARIADAHDAGAGRAARRWCGHGRR